MTAPSIEELHGDTGGLNSDYAFVNSDFGLLTPAFWGS